MGTTYAYQTLQVEYTEGSSSNLGGDGLQTPKLEVNFNVTCKEGKTCDENNDNYNRINLTNMPLLPDYKTADYTEFTLTNNSTSDVAYKINLTNITYSPNLVTSDFKYTITEIIDEVETIKFNGDFSTLSSTEFNLMPYTYLEKDKTKTIRIYLWLQETELEQNGLENTSFQGTIEIESLFLSDIPTLSNTIIASAKDAVINNDATRTLYNDTFNLNSITGVSSASDRMLALAEDDYGTSYVFRGAVKDNYVNFAGFTWRIVRINGDGSIRLILDGSLDKVSKDGVAVYTNSNLQALDSDGKIAFKTSPYTDNAYIGYMYGDENSGSYNLTHKNKYSSNVKTYLDTFYKEFLLTFQSDYIADTLFCGDKTRATGYIDKGFNQETTKYAAEQRLATNSVVTPTLECASSKNGDNLSEDERAYSRYTSIINSSNITTKGVLVNNDLTYPIGLLSADELVMAGAYYTTLSNTTYYLYDAFGYDKPLLSKYWWTMSPSHYINSTNLPQMIISVSDGKSVDPNSSVFSAFAVRPVINLKDNVIVSNGNGTESSPYVILANDGNSSETETPEEETVTFTFTTTTGEVSEEYTVPQGTTFETFVANNANFIFGPVYNTSVRDVVEYKVGSTGYYNCTSLNSTLAKRDTLIESGNYNCESSEIVPVIVT